MRLSRMRAATLTDAILFLSFPSSHHFSLAPPPSRSLPPFSLDQSAFTILLSSAFAPPSSHFHSPSLKKSFSVNNPQLSVLFISMNKNNLFLSTFLLPLPLPCWIRFQYPLIPFVTHTLSSLVSRSLQDAQTHAFRYLTELATFPAPPGSSWSTSYPSPNRSSTLSYLRVDRIVLGLHFPSS